MILEPTEVAFQKDWQRDYNRGSRALSSRVSDSDMQDALTRAVKAATNIFSEAWTKGGYAVVDASGPDVLRVRTGVMNIWLNAPDTQTAGRSYSFSPEAGRATLFVPVALHNRGASWSCGRPGVVGDSMTAWRTSASNRADFRFQVEQWASASVRGVSELKALSPINP